MAKELGLNYFKLRSKIRNGWTVDVISYLLGGLKRTV